MYIHIYMRVFIQRVPFVSPWSLWKNVMKKYLNFLYIFFLFYIKKQKQKKNKTKVCIIIQHLHKPQNIKWNDDISNTYFNVKRHHDYDYHGFV